MLIGHGSRRPPVAFTGWYARPVGPRAAPGPRDSASKAKARNDRNLNGWDKFPNKEQGGRNYLESPADPLRPDSLQCGTRQTADANFRGWMPRVNQKILQFRPAELARTIGPARRSDPISFKYQYVTIDMELSVSTYLEDRSVCCPATYFA